MANSIAEFKGSSELKYRVNGRSNQSRSYIILKVAGIPVWYGKESTLSQDLILTTLIKYSQRILELTYWNSAKENSSSREFLQDSFI